MQFLEKDLEDIIFEALQTEEGRSELLIKGFPYVADNPIVHRQFRIQGYGIADLIIVTENNGKYFIKIIELKKDKIGISAVEQICTYKNGIDNILINLLQVPIEDIDIDIQLILIGEDIKQGNFIYVTEQIQNLSIFKFKISLSGLNFTEVNTSRGHWCQISFDEKVDFSYFLKLPKEIKING